MIEPVNHTPFEDAPPGTEPRVSLPPITATDPMPMDVGAPEAADQAPTRVLAATGPLLLTAASGASIAQLVDEAVDAFPPRTRAVTIVLREEATALVHRVQTDLSSLTGALLAMRSKLTENGIHGATFALGGMGVFARSYRATTAEIDAAVGRGALQESYRIATDTGTMLIWCADLIPFDPSSQRGPSTPPSWDIFQMFCAAELVAFDESARGLELPRGAHEFSGVGRPVDLLEWRPRLGRALRTLLEDADVPPLARLPLSWIVIEWLRTIITARYGSAAVPLVTHVVAVAHIVAHLEDARSYGAWLRLTTPWTSLMEVVNAYVARNEVAEHGFSVPAARLAFDITSQKLVSVGPSFKLASWPMNETDKSFMPLLASQSAPIARVVLRTKGKGKHAETYATLVLELPTGTSATRAKHDAGVRRVLGIPEVDLKPYPIAFQETGFTTDHETDVPTIRMTSVPEPGGTEDITTEQMLALRDPVDFVVQLFRRLQTPFRTEQDARRFCMALATPLLREVCVGRLTAYLFEGPPGSGKGLAKEAIFMAWNRAAAPSAPGNCFLGVEGKDTHEQNLTFAQMGPRLFLSFTEIAKAGTSETLVRQTERTTVTGRGHHGDPHEVQNRYVMLADAVEGLPDRKELDRRMVRVKMRIVRSLDVTEEAGHGTRAFKPTTFLSTISDVGPMLIEGFRRSLEAAGREHINAMSDDSGRSSASNVLAKMCGVEQDAVSGGALEELWAMIADITTGVWVPTLGREPREVKARKKVGSEHDGQLAREFGKFSFTEVVKLAAFVPEHAELQQKLRGRTVKTQIETEFPELFVPLHGGKSRVLVVYANDKWWLYACIADAFVFAPFSYVEEWAARRLGPAAVANLSRAKSLATRRFKVRSEGVLALERLKDALVPMTLYGTANGSHAGETFNAIKRMHPELAQAACTAREEAAVVCAAVALAENGCLQGELDLLERVTRENVQAAGLHENPWHLSQAELDALVCDPRWLAFRKFRALHPICTVAPSIVVDLGMEAGLLSNDWALWAASNPTSGLDVAADMIRTIASTPFLEQFYEDFSDATPEDIALHAEQWATDWSTAA